MNTKMNIPKTLVVGYDERKDTYTGKLAYVIYKDHKGKLRKEGSWQSWRDKKIDPDEFDNEPASGFVLNKDVGGARRGWHSWDTRLEKVRVYDPRGFEFEITIPNLLFILQECTSIKGKGLEGEFVYAWDRSDLVLLPVCCKEYEECVQYTDYQKAKVTKNDMLEGCTYLRKDLAELMYLGRHQWYEPTCDYLDAGGKKYYFKNKGKKHIFIRLNNKNKRWREGEYIVEPGFTKLAKRLSQDPVPQYADAYEALQKSIYLYPSLKVKIIEKPLTKKRLDRYYMPPVLMEHEGEYYPSSIEKINSVYGRDELEKGTYAITRGEAAFSTFDDDDGKGCVVPTVHVRNYRPWYNHNRYDEINIPEKELLKKKFYTAALVNEKGGTYDVIN